MEVGEDALPSHSLSCRESFMMTSSLAWMVSISIPSCSLSSPTLFFSVLTSCWRLSFSWLNLSSWLERPRIWSSFWCRSPNVSCGTPSQRRLLVKYLSYWEDRTVCCRSRTSSWEPGEDGVGSRGGRKSRSHGNSAWSNHWYLSKCRNFTGNILITNFLFKDLKNREGKIFIP